MTHTLIAFALLLQDADPFVEIDDLLIDTLVYENVALTRVRVTLVNTNHEQERSVALTLLAPKDAAVYEFDAYGDMVAERATEIPAPDALATFMRMADRSRSREVGPVVFSTPSAKEIGKTVLDAMNELLAAPNFSRAVIQFALSAKIEGRVKEGAPSAANIPVQVDSFSVKISGRYAASLLQQVGDGRYQLMTYPLHGGDAPVLEVYFCRFVERDDDGAYRLDLPYAVSGRTTVRARQARVRLLSAGEVTDVACPSHESTAIEHSKSTRAELHLKPDESEIRVTYRLGPKAAPVDPADPHKKKWPLWDRDERDPLYRPADALAAVADPRVTADAAILVASNDLFLEVGMRPPKEVEQPFRSPRRIVK